jgi:hypothetical protein
LLESQAILTIRYFLGQALRELKAKGYRIVHMVPGPGTGPTAPAPKGWFSETGRVTNALRPRFEKSAAKAGDGPIEVKPAPSE